MSAIFGELLTFEQPGHASIKLRAFGDEHYARYETDEGYSVVFDPEQNRYCYARLSSGKYQSSGLAADQQPPAGLAKHLVEDKDVIAAKAMAKRSMRSSTARNPLAREINRTLGPAQGLLTGRVLAKGTIKGLTILVNFQDIQTSLSRNDIDGLLNGENYTANGNICSVRDYFKRVSNGNLDYHNVVVGPYTLSRNRQHYVKNLLVEEALQLALADGLDLRQFDSQNEGVIDALSVLYAGQTQYAGELWPHNWSINLKFGTIRTDQYMISSLGRSAADLSIGTFCHETGHMLCRFPDLYDYGERDGNLKASAGLGSFCLMAAGNHLDYGRSPAPVCAYLRDLVGWCDKEINLNQPGEYEAIHGDYGTVIKFQTSKPNEYFLIENRSRVGLDRAGVSSGLAVYHCDILGSNEWEEGTAMRHYQCGLLQADGTSDLESNRNRGDAADLFAGLAGVALSDATSPSSREWNGRDSGLTLAGIPTPSERMGFRIGADQGEPAGHFTQTETPNLPIPDNTNGGVTSSIHVETGGVVKKIIVKLDILHPYIGDLEVRLTAPSGKSTLLHQRLGNNTDNIIETYDSSSPGVLTVLVGEGALGFWRLTASDRAPRDVGVLKSWSLELETG